MFTLYRIVKRSVAETVSERAPVHTKNSTFATISGLLCSILKICNTCNAVEHFFPFQTVPDQILRRSISLSGTA